MFGTWQQCSPVVISCPSVYICTVYLCQMYSITVHLSVYRSSLQRSTLHTVIILYEFLLMVWFAHYYILLLGSSHLTGSPWKRYCHIGQVGDAELENFIKALFNIQYTRPFKVLMRPRLKTYQFTFFFSVSWQVLTLSGLRIPTYRCLKLLDQWGSVFHLFLVSYWLNV
jgi:hypothetical protein